MYSGVCRLDSWPRHRLFWQQSSYDSFRYIPRQCHELNPHHLLRLLPIHYHPPINAVFNVAEKSPYLCLTYRVVKVTARQGGMDVHGLIRCHLPFDRHRNVFRFMVASPLFHWPAPCSTDQPPVPQSCTDLHCCEGLVQLIVS